eukprot:CAMPEP_0174351754 /NCGR_PEP_ID=MMETSP0811_2-20130205/9202_1 /TAXON_ID=73025 ORGANISM="Eutreptiella gymnastica-like, Strain CCMP1594" /NCGR_SAMPLE_ID=MMETSP0811_2 /ASSEMBLY_ACC=CAM_ASM_000667 /LENGTH=152 /DNA_ID=CAMNT_0015481275 /DNA_START=117 /DNA_END=575 /DNA_ORIENTATION=-
MKTRLRQSSVMCICWFGASSPHVHISAKRPTASTRAVASSRPVALLMLVERVMGPSVVCGIAMSDRTLPTPQHSPLTTRATSHRREMQQCTGANSETRNGAVSGDLRCRSTGIRTKRFLFLLHFPPPPSSSGRECDAMRPKYADLSLCLCQI